MIYFCIYKITTIKTHNIYYKDKILKIQSSRLQQVLEILKYYKLQIQHQAKRDLKAMSGTIYVAIP